MVRGHNPPLEGTESEGPCVLETLVPTPLFPGQVDVDGSNAISFAPATAEFATPVTHGTLMADFVADHRALRDSADVFPAKKFEKLVITVCASATRSFSLPHLCTRSGPVSSESGKSRWGASARIPTISLVRNWQI